MKKFFYTIIAVVIMSIFVPTVYAAEDVPKKVLEQTESVVRIIAEYKDEYSTGTGFVIKNDKEGTFIVTNNHVVADNPDSIYIFFGEETVYADIVAKTSQKDMAVLKLEYSVSVEPLKLASKSAQRGAAVYAAGFPGASDYLSDVMGYRSEDVTITDGIVSAEREFTMSLYGTSAKMLQINAAINSGNSGGPLFNEKGEVIGINTLGIGESQGVFAAIDVGELKVFLDNNGIKIKKFDFDILRIIAAALLVAVFILKIKKDSIKAKQLVSEHKFIPEEDVIEISVKTDNGKITLKFPELKLPKLNTKLFVIVSGVVLIVAVAGFHIGTMSYAKTEDFVEAKNVIVLPTVKYIDSQLYRYMYSTKLMTKGEFDAAKNNFKEMSGYLYADKMVYEADYRKAERLADSDDFSAAVTIYRNLDKNGYKDAAEKLIETKYRQGMYMYEMGNYHSALKVLGELRNDYEPAEYAFAEIQFMWVENLLAEEDYLEAYEVVMQAPENFTKEDISAVKEYVYLEGQSWYRTESYENAKECFNALGDYKDSEKYIAIIKAVDFFNNDDPKETVGYLKNIIDFENVGHIIVSKYEIAMEFLKGRWLTNDRQYELYIYNNGEAANSLPMLKEYENCYYYIENGEYQVYQDDYEDYRVAYNIEALTADSIKIYCFADNNTYILYRQ